MSTNRWSIFWLRVSCGSTLCDHRKGWTPCSRKGLCANSLFEINMSCSSNLIENKLDTVEDFDITGSFRGKYKIHQGWKVMYAFKINLNILPNIYL